VNGASASAEILEIRGPEELLLKKPFQGKPALRQLTGRDDIGDGDSLSNGDSQGPPVIAEGFEGTSYKTAPKVDQTMVYNEVFKRLNQGGCIGIFPEGGSHDRPELLPLKRKCLSGCMCRPVLMLVHQLVLRLWLSAPLQRIPFAG
jgi:glycerol-3-phosphate O-acyltransferase/dihydroxyacetone phosphate acyltransferase